MCTSMCSVVIKTEADTDMSEYPDDDMPSTGMFAVSDDIFTVVSCRSRVMFTVYIVSLMLCSTCYAELLMIMVDDECCCYTIKEVMFSLLTVHLSVCQKYCSAS